MGLIEEWMLWQKKALSVILKEYELNELDKAIIEDYRSIGLISQYSNLLDFKRFMKKDKEKVLKIIRLILKR